MEIKHGIKVLLSGLLLLGVNICLGVTATHSATEANSLTLVADGEPRCAIVLAEEPTTAAQLGALDLQWHLQAMTGAQVPILPETEPVPVGAIPIHVGVTRAVRSLGYDADGFGENEFVVAFHDAGLVLAGHDAPHYDKVLFGNPADLEVRGEHWPGPWQPQGSAHAVYEFLMTHCGVRWLDATEVGVSIPRVDTLRVEPRTIRRSPAFVYRDGAVPHPHYDRLEGFNSYWAREQPERNTLDRMAYAGIFSRWGESANVRNWHLRLMGNLHLRRHKYFGSEAYAGNHGFYGYYDRFWEPNPSHPERFEAHRPEFFAQGYEGRPPQLCYTNPDLIEQVIADARNYFDGTNKVGQHARGDYFSLVPMDNSRHCHCARCRALFNTDELNNPSFFNGRTSDLIFTFGNAVARAIRESHPGKYLSMLSYMDYTYLPRDIVLEDNISIQLCLGARGIPTADDPEFRHRYDDWLAAYPNHRFFVWLYYCHPMEFATRGGNQWHQFPPFTAHATAHLFSRFHADGIRGLFFNGFERGAEGYVILRLLDDPAQDVDALLEDYYLHAYREAAEPMLRFHRLVQSRWIDRVEIMPPISGDRGSFEEISWGVLGNAATMNALQALLDEARSLARAPVVHRRLDLFEYSVWNYMHEGRKKYIAKVRPMPGNPLVYSVPHRALLGDTPSAAILERFGVNRVLRRNAQGEPTRRIPEIRLSHDGERLFVQLHDPDTPAPSSEAGAADRVRMIFYGGGDVDAIDLEIEITAGGGTSVWAISGGVRTPLSIPVAVTQRADAVSGWRMEAALPLSELRSLFPAGHLRFNLVRVMPGTEGGPMLTPTLQPFPGDGSLYAVLRLAPVPTPHDAVTEGRDDTSASLTAHWDFQRDDADPDRILDRSGNDVHGRVEGRGTRRFMASPHGEARSFPHATFDEAPFPQLVPPFTLEMWVLPPRVLNAKQWRILTGRNGRWRLSLRPETDAVYFDFFDPSSPGKWKWMNSYLQAHLSPYHWNHVVASHDGTHYRMTINGIDLNHNLAWQTHPFPAPREDPAPFRIGGGMPGRFDFPGWFDEVRIYPRVLTRAEILEHFRKGVEREVGRQAPVPTERPPTADGEPEALGRYSRPTGKPENREGRNI